MAKELPYFKFEPNQWENGNIQMLTHEEKGVFIDLCSMYWSRLGEVPYRLAVQKICGGNASALESLCEENIIAIDSQNIRIKFLDEQLAEFTDAAEKNRENALKRWEKHRNSKEKSERNATALQSQSERNAIREDKIREDKIREDKSIEDKIKRENEFRHSAHSYQSEYSLEMIKAFCDYWTESKPNGKKMKFEMQKTFDIGRRLQTWERNGFGNKTTKQEQNDILNPKFW